jgi:DNA-binding transcriptional LysR family regulator
MTLQQLRVVCEIAANNFNASRAALTIHASQPAVSKMLASLECELGAEIFLRAKGRIVGLTEFGTNVLELARRMVHDARSLHDMAADSYNEAAGALRIASTHLLARHMALRAAAAFAREYPRVDLEISQHNPRGVLDAVAAGDSQLGLTALPGAVPEGVVTFHCNSVDRCVITPLGHSLLKRKRISLRQLVEYPMVSYDRSVSFGRGVLAEFERHGLRPRVAIKATSADVVKAAVATGLGIAVFQRMAIEPEDDQRLGIIEAGHLFPSSHVHIALRRGQYLRRFTYEFIALIAPQWTKKEIDAVLAAR